jgi:uncharacterized protein (TIGR03435 family)
MAGRLLLATSLLVLVAARSMPAQAPLAFEVASLTPSPYPNAREDLFTPPDSPIIITNYSLRDLIAYAYGLKSRHELSGGPQWLLQEKFVINAVPPPGTTATQIPLMVQNLLAERFRLRLRKEDGELPVWALALDRPNGPLGPQLTPSGYDCRTFLASGKDSPVPMRPRDQEGRLVCGTSTTISGLDGATLRIRGVPIGELAGHLDTAEYTGLGRPLVDRTGLTGNYDVHVTFGVPVRTSGAPLQTAPPIAVALREQLGLKLESSTAPGMRYVIESVERPITD